MSVISTNVEIDINPDGFAKNLTMRYACGAICALRYARKDLYHIALSVAKHIAFYEIKYIAQACLHIAQNRMRNMNYKIYLLYAIVFFVVTIISVCICKAKKATKSNSSAQIVINRAWVINTVVGVVFLLLGIVMLPWFLGWVFIGFSVLFLAILVLLFESSIYVFDDKGITFVGVCFKLAYIKYEDVRDLLQRWEWYMDSLVLSNLTQYYELYGPAEEKFNTWMPLRITKTKKTTELLKEYCPRRFQILQEKIEKEKNKKHSKKKK